MDWDDPDKLRQLADGLEDSQKVLKFGGTKGNAISGTAEQLIGALGRPELGGSYFTLSDDNNYAIWAFLKECNERGWLYKGRDVMPWCPRCSTALSEHEIATEGYRELSHSAVTLRFPIRGKDNAALLVWTTTPWTLTSNVAAAVNPEIKYVGVLKDGETLYLAKSLLNRYFPGHRNVREELTGRDLEGLMYDGPFDELEIVKKVGAKDNHRVILWNDVSETEGTGVVHIAPGCGKEDFELSHEYKMPVLSPLNEYGIFTDGFGEFTGVHVYESPQKVIADLKRKGILFKVEQYSHRYPVCWRCGSELVFRLVDEWFISMGKKSDKSPEQLTREEKMRNLRYQIMENTMQIRWFPSYGLSQELDWLRNMGDWMISKKRYWGLALPIWECQSCGKFEVIGSEQELKTRAVEGWQEFEGHSPHKPWVDAIKIKCSSCQSVVSRISDVGNPWLDAGIVAYSTMGYFSDRSYWEKWFPAELICESLPGQFRNWFYSLLAMSTVLKNQPPCRKIFGHGQVLAEDGREMHKSLGTAIWFDEAAESMGADVMRWMYCTTRPETNMRFGYHIAEDIKRRFLLPLWNIYYFFVTYAALDQWKPSSGEPSFSSLDRWILSKLQILIEDVTSNLDNLDPIGATTQLEAYVDDLSKWYVRRSRRRFWKSETDEDKKAAYATLYTCLTSVVRLLAPFIPFFVEEIYQNLVRSVDKNAPVSVHHNAWPVADESLIDRELVAAMNLAVKVCTMGHAARNTAGIKLRQPLAMAAVVADKTILNRLGEVKGLIRDELNVKNLELITSKEDLLGKSDRPAREYVFQEEEGVSVALDTRISEELKKEGVARDIVRRIQDQRKKAGLEVSEHIALYYQAGPTLKGVFSTHRDYIATETLAKKLIDSEPPTGSHTNDYTLLGEKLIIGIIRANGT
jgi:isoleucyl-tRNA synthetase